MRAIVTGAAGFIGSHLCEALLARGDEVRGLDCFTPYYDRAIKQSNLDAAKRSSLFSFVEGDLLELDLIGVLEGADSVFHLAGQPGVRHSWSAGFPDYVRHNIVATQRLLEAAVRSNVQKFVYASSSSVYGNAPSYPTSEESLPGPHSPYGVTKLAGEHLCGLYAANWGLPTVSLRYFTVYGPRQRPDMAMHRLLEAVLMGSLFPLYGDGMATREFTYIDDVVRATVASAELQACSPGTIINVAGGESTNMASLIGLVGRLAGHAVQVDRCSGQAGDVARTAGNIERASRLLGWTPRTPLEVGVNHQLHWHEARKAMATSKT